MGFLDVISGIFNNESDPACPACGATLDNEHLVSGSWWCEACGGLYKEMGGELVDVKDLRDSGGPGGSCNACQSSLAGGDRYLPYEDGSNEYAYIKCPSCGHENIREGFGE